MSTTSNDGYKFPPYRECLENYQSNKPLLNQFMGIVDNAIQHGQCLEFEFHSGYPLILYTLYVGGKTDYNGALHLFKTPKKAANELNKFKKHLAKHHPEYLENLKDVRKG